MLPEGACQAFRVAARGSRGVARCAMDEDGEPPDVCHLCNREQAPRGGVPSLAKTLLMCENAFSDPPTCDLEAHPFCVGLDQLPETRALVRGACLHSRRHGRWQ